MANKQRGEVSIRLDKRRTLKFTFQGLACFKQLTGQSVDGFFFKLFNTKGLDATQKVQNAMDVFSELELRNLLWAALLHEEPALTPEQVAGFMDFAEGDSIPEKSNAICLPVMEAWALTRPEPVKKNLLSAIKSLSSAKTQTPSNGNGSSEQPTDISTLLPTSSGD